ncbi:hypothetical protein SKAU_G00137910 [Synaphobranchus kaupii]|uniref:Uncharacterized protein n=1 Tax=Synaphobranchus kaupii TaxID=118154 RepID=A0A9Q1FRN3_SYNKA|nr:hypothetical protein SKAU_G00137910 [Synaphobranchus kaupii]
MRAIQNEIRALSQILKVIQSERTGAAHSVEKQRSLLSRKRIFFDQDYPPETLKKRKAYTEGGILKELKAKGIRFQTPYPAKLRVFFESSTQIYECAAEAAKDLKKKGFSLGNVKGPDSTQPKQRRLATWEKAGADRRRQPVDQEWIRERLRSFRRAPPGQSGY